MENEITPEQKAQIATWVGQRDLILFEISSLQTAKEKLDLENKSLAISNTDLDKRINISIGRIEELTKKENELKSLISKEMVGLESQKTCLETQVTSLLKEIELLSSQKQSINNDLLLVLNTFEIVKGETKNLDTIVGRVTQISEKNSLIIQNLASDLVKSLNSLFDISQKNISETNQVLDKLPKMLVELQKVKLIKNKI